MSSTSYRKTQLASAIGALVLALGAGQVRDGDGRHHRWRQGSGGGLVGQVLAGGVVLEGG